MLKFYSVLILCLLPFFGNAQKTTAGKIREMIELTGASQNFDIGMKKMMDLQKKSLTGVPKEFWDRMEVMIMDSMKQKLFDELVPIYEKHLTESDIDAIIAFYKSPAGQNLKQKQPFILAESMELGYGIGMELGKQIAEAIMYDRQVRFDSVYTDCDHVKTGNFAITSEEGKVVSIQRTKSTQTESHGNTVSKFKIEWLDDCRYRLELISSNDPELKRDTYQTTIVNIVKFSPYRYSFLVKKVGLDPIFEGSADIIE